MNFDEDEESDFSLNTHQSGNKFASLFNMNEEQVNNEKLKFKSPKQPQQLTTESLPSTAKESKKSSVSFFTNVQAFKYISNQHELQGKLGLAVLSSNNTYKLLLYVSKAQPLSIIEITTDFKIAMQKNNYSSFYDEDRQLWSVLFETEDLLADFAKNIFLCKINLKLEKNNILSTPVKQDLCNNDNDNVLTVEDSDSIEIETLVTIVKDGRLSNVIENTKGAPSKLRLGRNKIPKLLEDMLISTKQGDRKLFAFMGKHLQPYFSNIIDLDSVIFYEVRILRIKKNDRKDRSMSNTSVIDKFALPQLTAINQQLDNSRSRTNSVNDQSNNINGQLNESKLDKQRLISRIAKMGQQLMPKYEAELPFDNNDKSTNEKSELSFEKKRLDCFESIDNNRQNILNQEQLYKEQIKLQNQFQQNTELMHNIQNLNQEKNQQLALFKPASLFDQNNSRLITYPHDSIIQSESQQSTRNPNQPIHDIDALKIFQKLDVMNEKLENINSISKVNQQNLPSMETDILLQNIQRIVRENEQYKKELYEKSQKIEKQNVKITELLVKSQTYVEQNHKFLEQKNNSYESNSERNTQRILELEQDKMRLTCDLSKLTAEISDLNLEIVRVKKNEAENKNHLIEVSKNSDFYKQNSERLTLENADIQIKIDNSLAEFKKEKQLRKTLENQNFQKDEEIYELGSSLAINQKLLEEKKRKLDKERSDFEIEIEEIKSGHILEINEMKEKMNRSKSKNKESQQEIFKETEFELNNEWQLKLDTSISQMEQKNERSIQMINIEKNEIEKQLADTKKQINSYKSRFSILESENYELIQKLDELAITKEKYVRLQTQALIVKERYEKRIKELIEADPDPEVICDEVKKVMNLIYRQIKIQIRPEEYYFGNGILIGMLKIIKFFTIRIVQQIASDDEEDQEKFNVFSQHILQQKNSSLEQSSFDIMSNKDTAVNIDNVQDRLENNEQVASIEIIEEKFGTDTVTKKASSLKNEYEPVKKEIDSDETESTMNIITNKIIDSSDEDGDDKSIQAINDEEQSENELIIEKSIIKDSKTSNILKDNSLNQNEDNEIKNNIETIMENKQVVTASDDSIDMSTNKDMVKSKDEPIDSKEEMIKSKDESIDFEEGMVEKKDEPIDSKEEKIKSKDESIDFEEGMIEKKDESLNAPELTSIEQGRKIENILEKNRIPVLSRGLFDDSDDEEDDELFSFTSDKAEKITKSVIVSTSSVVHNNSNADSLSKSMMTPFMNTQKESLNNLKFSPPPLFDEEENNDKEEIDWFK